MSRPRTRSGRAPRGLPQIVISSVDLPAPLAPISATISPAADLEIDALQRLDIAVEGMNAADVSIARRRRWNLTPSLSRPASCNPGMSSRSLNLQQSTADSCAGRYRRSSRLSPGGGELAKLRGIAAARAIGVMPMLVDAPRSAAPRSANGGGQRRRLVLAEIGLDHGRVGAHLRRRCRRRSCGRGRARRRGRRCPSRRSCRARSAGCRSPPRRGSRRGTRRARPIRAG